MKYTTIGKTEIKISEIGLGTRLVDEKTFSLQKNFEHVISYAIQQGVNFFVGAGHYSGGKAEKLLGTALEPYRDKVVIATSAGVIHTKDNVSISLSVPLIKQQLEESLKNYHTDHIDLFQLHYYDPTCNFKELYTYIEELYESQIVRLFGVSNFRLAELKNWEGPAIQSVQMPYNPLQREIEKDYATYCKDHNISILGYTPFCGGLLAKGLSIDQEVFPYVEFLSKAKLDQVEILLTKLQNLASKLLMSRSELILLWLKEKKILSSILIGSTNVEHLEEIIKALDRRLREEELYLINECMNDFWSNFPGGVTIPLTITERINEINGKNYTKVYGSYIPLPDYVKEGDTVQINDTLGEIM